MVGFTDPLEESVPMDYHPAPDAAASTTNNGSSSGRPTSTMMSNGLPPLSPRSAAMQQQHESGPNHHHNDIGVTSSNEDDDEETDVEGEKESVKRWDEGGASDCGYSHNIHETLMSVGSKVHALVGAPTTQVRRLQDSIGTWFQELSYATRDILRGENTDEMHKDAADAVSTLFYGEDDEKKTDDGDKESSSDAVVLRRDAESTFV